jgi:hypothetical protein
MGCFRSSLGQCRRSEGRGKADNRRDVGGLVQWIASDLPTIWDFARREARHESDGELACRAKWLREPLSPDATLKSRFSSSS